MRGRRPARVIRPASSTTPTPPADPDTTCRVPVRRVTAQEQRRGDDLVAREEPLAIQIGATPVTVTMRTPGHDDDLALGWLAAEGVIAGPDDVLALHHDRVVPDGDAQDNVLRVHLRADLAVDLRALRRHGYATSSCGLCGKTTVADVLRTALPLDDPSTFDPAMLARLPTQLEAQQATFAATGGLHAAALVAPDGGLLVAREDIGRHNAVDKVIGWALRDRRLPLRGHVLLVSGRISFEIVQKALVARLPAIAAVSAPSSLAIELATDAGMLLVGFLRHDRMNAYGAVTRLGCD